VRMASVKRRCRQNANFPKYIELFTPPRQVKSEKFARFCDAKSHQFMGFGRRANFSPPKCLRSALFDVASATLVDELWLAESAANGLSSGPTT